MEACPGWYCGRVNSSSGVLGECGSCPRGFRRNDTTFVCEPCTDSLAFYDWLYLGFMVLLVLVLHWFFIDMVSMRRSFGKDILILHFTALVEVLLAGALSLLFTAPFGTFSIECCRVKTLADWYTLLHNPAPDYERKVHCTQEAVYPLYTLVFVFYTLALVLMLLVRPWVCRKFLARQSKMSIYAAMYYIPILVLIHALIGGLLYYSFPILIVILSVISCAYHFAQKFAQTATALIVTTIMEPRNVVILVGHWCLHAYGLISLTQLADPMCHSLLLLLVPVPSLFYIFTAKFTDPDNFM